MPVADALLVVEGPQDAEFAGQLLKAAGCRRVTRPDRLPDDWRRLIPTRYPKANRGIDQVHEVPQFRRQGEDGLLVATVIAGSDSKLASSLVAALDGLGRIPPAVGIVLDDDREVDPLERHQRLVESIRTAVDEAGLSLVLPSQPGTVQPTDALPRLEVFILPDNQARGTLEDVLLEAGRVAYHRLLEQAAAFVEDLDLTGLTADDLRERNKPSGRRKQVVGVATAILKPGRTVAVTLQDNRWLKGDAQRTPLVAGFRRWLRLLLDLPVVP